jgi:hypothetical protein
MCVLVAGTTRYVSSGLILLVLCYGRRAYIRAQLLPPRRGKFCKIFFKETERHSGRKNVLLDELVLLDACPRSSYYLLVARTTIATSNTYRKQRDIQAPGKEY